MCTTLVYYVHVHVHGTCVRVQYMYIGALRVCQFRRLTVVLQNFSCLNMTRLKKTLHKRFSNNVSYNVATSLAPASGFLLDMDPIKVSREPDELKHKSQPYCLFPGCIVTWAWSLAKGQYTVEWLLTGAPHLLSTCTMLNATECNKICTNLLDLVEEQNLLFLVMDLVALSRLHTWTTDRCCCIEKGV